MTIALYLLKSTNLTESDFCGERKLKAILQQLNYTLSMA